MKIANCVIDEKKIENFWNLDLLGIQENEHSACENVLSRIEFVNDRDEVKLPFKENVVLVSDNYEMSQNRLNKLKKKLSQNRDNFTEYNNVMKDQLKNGIIEKVEEFQTFAQNRVVEIRKNILPENGVIVQPKLTLPI